MAKTNKRTIMKGHSIARSIGKKRGSNPFAIGMAVAKRQAAKRKAARSK
jgi:hypothetical protein